MAADMWNRLWLNPPPIVNCCYRTSLEISELGNIKSISDVLLSITSCVKGNVTYCEEVAFFNEVVYKLAALFRNDKKINLLKQVKKCLMRVLAMKLGEYSEKLSQDLVASFNSMFIANKYNPSVYLPSKQMFEYILVRIMGFAKLLIHTLQYIQQSCLNMLQLLYLGHFRNVSCMTLCTLSRLWLILRVWLLRSCGWYKQLRPFADKLKATSGRWLSNDMQLPSDLKEWLGEGAKYLQSTKSKVGDKNLLLLARLGSDQINFEVSSTLDTLNDIQVPQAQPEPLDEEILDAYSDVFPTEADVGVALDRSSFLNRKPDEKVETQKGPCKDVINSVLTNDLVSMKSIARWIKKERYCRCKEIMATSHFTIKQFHVFEKQLATILNMDKKQKDLESIRGLIKRWLENPLIMRKQVKISGVSDSNASTLPRKMQISDTTTLSKKKRRNSKKSIKEATIESTDQTTCVTFAKNEKRNKGKSKMQKEGNRTAVL